MSFDCTLLMNLKRREDKWWFAKGCLASLEFDLDNVIRFISHDCLDYPDSESVRQAAIEDGFDSFYEADASIVSRNVMAWNWTFQSALRYIVETDKTTLLLIDDCLPRPSWTFHRLCLLKDECEDQGEFRILQLNRSFAENFYINEKPHTSIIAKGLSGANDCGTILNAVGAQLLLDMYVHVFIEKQRRLSPDDLFLIIAQREKDPEYGIGMWHTLESILNMYSFDTDLGGVPQ